MSVPGQAQQQELVRSPSRRRRRRAHPLPNQAQHSPLLQEERPRRVQQHLRIRRPQLSVKPTRQQFPKRVLS